MHGETINIFFQSGRAKDLSATLYVWCESVSTRALHVTAQAEHDTQQKIFTHRSWAVVCFVKNV